MCMLSLQSCPTLCCPHGLELTRLLCPWDSPGRNTGVGLHALFQGICPTQGWNPCLMSSTLAGRFFPTSATWEAPLYMYSYTKLIFFHFSLFFLHIIKNIWILSFDQLIKRELHSRNVLLVFLPPLSFCLCFYILSINILTFAFTEPDKEIVGSLIFCSHSKIIFRNENKKSNKLNPWSLGMHIVRFYLANICQFPWMNRRTLSLFSSDTKKIEIILRTHFPHVSSKAWYFLAC